MKQFREIPTLNFGDAIVQAANHIVRFNGRARRSEYWWTQLLVFGISFFLTPMGGLIAELVLVPLTFRRLHDTGKSGWWWSVGAILSALYFILLLSDIASFISFIANGVFSKIDIDAYTPLEYHRSVG